MGGRVAPAQIDAIGKWGTPRAGAFDYLREITHPALVINGNNDVIIYTVNSFILQQSLPNAQLILYPDSNHGSQYQYPALFVADVRDFWMPWHRFQFRRMQIMADKRMRS